MANHMTIICRVKGETILRLDNRHVFYLDGDDHHYHQHNHLNHHHNYRSIAINDNTNDNDLYDLNDIKQEAMDTMDPFDDPLRDCPKLRASFDENYSLCTETIPNMSLNGFGYYEQYMRSQPLQQHQGLDSYLQYLVVSKCNGRQKFVCKWKGCQYESMWRNAIVNHIRTHMQYFPFTCHYPGCDKRFAISSNLKNHRKTHFAKQDVKPIGPTNGRHFSLINMNGDNWWPNVSTTSNVANRKTDKSRNKKSLSGKMDGKKWSDNAFKKTIKGMGSHERSGILQQNGIIAEKRDNQMMTNGCAAETERKPMFDGIKSVEQYFTLSTGKDGKTWRTCRLCGYCTPYPTSTIYHMRTKHFDDKQYVCDDCGKRFAIKTNLNNHKRCHKPNKTN